MVIISNCSYDLNRIDKLIEIIWVLHTVFHDYVKYIFDCGKYYTRRKILSSRIISLKFVITEEGENHTGKRNSFNDKIVLYSICI